jgi:hypothetical protein
MATCEICGGKGTVTYDIPATEAAVGIGGMNVQGLGGFCTRPCACVRDLPAIYGEAKWWDSEMIRRDVIEIPVGDRSVSVKTTCEVPRDDGGRRLHRTVENSYFSPLIEFETDGDELTLLAGDARKVAAALIAAADACDAIETKSQALTDAAPTKGT